MEEYDIVALGESLVDFVTVKGKEPGKIYLEGNAGGAPSNVLAMAAKLGRKTAFVGKVGNDAFGKYLRASIEKSGVETQYMLSGDEPTTLAMVMLDGKGDRSFSFYRNQTADVMLHERELNKELLANCKVFHFGTVSMASEPARGTTLAAAQRAKEAGAKISFDPNYRPFLWRRMAEAIDAITSGLELADYVKLSEEEAEIITGVNDPEKAALALNSRYGFAFTTVTLGAQGCVGVTSSARVKRATYDVKTVDTTGAGDAFWGAVLHRLLGTDSSKMDDKELTDILSYGNAAGSLVTAAHGAIAPQPSDAAIRRCMKETSLL